MSSQETTHKSVQRMTASMSRRLSFERLENRVCLAAYSVPAKMSLAAPTAVESLSVARRCSSTWAFLATVSPTKCSVFFEW